MKKKDLINKWLNNEQLTKQESEAFEQLNAYDSYVKISETAKKFNAPSYDTKSNQEILNKELLELKRVLPKNSYRKTFMRIAAIFVIGIGIYFSFFKEYNTTISTLVSENSTIELPDNSTVKLNALSSVTYSKENWTKERKITLDGEAYFSVATGKKFDVHTSSGIISVIGTRFNIKQRDDFLEVICYEGVVSVTISGETKFLREGDILEFNSEQILKKKNYTIEPQWFSKRSLFYNAPYTAVLKEFGWQYGVTIESKNIDSSIIFTGNFVHSDILTALKSITIPMRLKYVIKNKTVTLYKE